MRTLLILLSLTLTTICVKGQSGKCDFEIRVLYSRGSQHLNKLDSLEFTDQVLVRTTDVNGIQRKIDTACCTYAGAVYFTSYRVKLSSDCVSRMAHLNIPLCCGIPVAIFQNGKEKFRARLWNIFSSFSTTDVVIILSGQNITIQNQLPNVNDQLNSKLIENELLLCNQ